MKVLVVAGEDLLHDVVHELLAARGWEATSADLRSACEAARAHSPEIIVMQVRRSVEVHDIRRVRAVVAPHVEVVAATSGDLLTSAIAAGATDFIALPTERKVLDAQLSIIARRIEEHVAALQRIERATQVAEAARTRAQAAEETARNWLLHTTQLVRGHLAPALKQGRDLLRATSEENAQAVSSLTFVCREMAAAGVLVGDVAAAVQIESGQDPVQVGEVDALELLAKAAAAVEAETLRRGNRLSVRHDDEKIALTSDASKVQRALVLLLSNATRFTVRGEIELSCRVKDGWVLFAVRDSGLGIDPELHQTVFEPFYHGAHGDTGAGLGLALVKRIADAIGGEVQLQSVPGRGSMFTLCVPLRPPYED